MKKPEVAHEHKNPSLPDVGTAVNQSAFELDEFNDSPGTDEVTTNLVRWLHNEKRQTD